VTAARIQRYTLTHYRIHRERQSYTEYTHSLTTEYTYRGRGSCQTGRPLTHKDRETQRQRDRAIHSLTTHRQTQRDRELTAARIQRDRADTEYTHPPTHSLPYTQREGAVKQGGSSRPIRRPALHTHSLNTDAHTDVTAARIQRYTLTHYRTHRETALHTHSLTTVHTYIHTYRGRCQTGRPLTSGPSQRCPAGRLLETRIKPSVNSPWR
jgi:hypothetical protein